MGRLFKNYPFVLVVVFIVAGIFSTLLIPMSVRESSFTNIQTVSGTIERLEISERNNATVNIILAGDEKPYWIIPASFRQITGQGVFSKELILSYLPTGLYVELQVVPFRGDLSVKGIVAGDSVIMCIAESEARAYSDSRVTLWMGIILVSILFPLAVLFLAFGIRRIVKERKLDSSEKNEYGVRKIFYEFLGNKIEVFHEVNNFVLSIFVNGELRQQVGSFVAATQRTQISIQPRGEGEESFVDEILTLTNNGFGTLCLYHKGNRLVKKRQPFG